jgi:hypothetical protein
VPAVLPTAVQSPTETQLALRKPALATRSLASVTGPPGTVGLRGVGRLTRITEVVPDRRAVEDGATTHAVEETSPGDVAEFGRLPGAASIVVVPGEDTPNVVVLSGCWW